MALYKCSRQVCTICTQTYTTGTVIRDQLEFVFCPFLFFFCSSAKLSNMQNYPLCDHGRMRYPFSNYQLTSFLLHLLLDLGIASKPNSDDLFRLEFSQLPASSTTVLEVLFPRRSPCLPTSLAIPPSSPLPIEASACIIHLGGKRRGEGGEPFFPPSVRLLPSSVRSNSLAKMERRGVSMHIRFSLCFAR